MNKLLLSLVLAGAAAQLSAQTYADFMLSPRQRAESLVKELTLEEKVSLMQHQSPAIDRLGIKQYNWWNEALHGVARAGTATVFPQPIGMAASFDDKLVYDVFTATSDEARAKNQLSKQDGALKIYQGLTFWTPNINIYRDPRWGRGHETYGEDPYLTGRMGTSVVRGLQGDYFKGGRYKGPDADTYYKLYACAKHFAVHSGPEWNRHSFNAKDIAPRDMAETYLPAFKTLVQDAGVKQVMCAYNRLEDEPCCGSNNLLKNILRNDWGFEGVVVSDCWAIGDFYNGGCHETDPDQQHAVARAVRAGTDVECGPTYAGLVDAVKQGLITEAEIDESLIRVLESRFELGEMDPDAIVPWTYVDADVICSDKHRALAKQMALESIVLLKNDGILPLKKGKKIGLIGPNANDSVMQWGNYNGFPTHTSTLLSELQKRVAADRLTYIDGIDHTYDKMIVSYFDKTKASDGKPGFDAKFWNGGNRYRKEDVTHHYTTPLSLTTAGATVWAPGVDLGGFEGEMVTKFVAPADETIIFSVQTQGQVMVEIDGKNIFWAGNMKNPRACWFEAEKGKEYEIKIIYFATEGDCASMYVDFGSQAPLDVDAVARQLKDVDVVVFAGGLSPMLEGEEMPSVRVEGFRGGDRDIIELPGVQRDLLKAIKKLGKKIIYVNYSGSAVALTDEDVPASAIIQAWYPGEAGGEAVAGVIFGDYNPSGKLPITFYNSTSELPDFMDYSMSNRTYRYFNGTPLYPFGHGLSYTKFNIGKASISTDGDAPVLTVPVSNKGKIAGTETVQVYVARPSDTDGPKMQLRDFSRVALRPGETKNVSFILTPDHFEWFDPASGEARPLDGEFVIYYGDSSSLSSLKSIDFSR